MTQINTATVAEVAGQLSDLEIRAVTEVLDSYFGRGPRAMCQHFRISKPKAQAVLRNLRTLGVVDYGVLVDEYDGLLGGWGYWLDAFGQAVREHLLAGVEAREA